MEIFEITKGFPPEERYSLTDQIRRSSRSVCQSIGESWRKRRYPKHFVSKISDAETEAEETRVWLEFCLHCGYISKEQFADLDDRYDHIISQLVLMANNPDKWCRS
jgi:four helix bundle protein